MERRTATRLTVAASVAIGLSFAVAPQWVSGAASADPAPARTVAAAEQPSAASEIAGPVDLPLPAPTPYAAAVSGDTSETVVAVTSEAATPEAAVPEPTTSTTAPVVAPVAADAPPVAPTVAPAVRGTVHVDVVATTGATRTVSLVSADGPRVGGPVAVDGDRITFADLADGTYDLLVEQVGDDGGAFVTRTVLEITGGVQVVSCDAETLDCTVA